MKRHRVGRGGSHRIARIRGVRIVTYRDSGQVKAYVDWATEAGGTGTTEGDPFGAHMAALIDRARREGAPIRQEKW